MKGEIQIMNTNSAVLIVDETNVLSFMSASLSNIGDLVGTDIQISMDIFRRYCEGLHTAYRKYKDSEIGAYTTLGKLIPVNMPVIEYLELPIRKRFLITLIVLGNYLIQTSKSSRPALVFEDLSYTQGFTSNDLSTVSRIIKAFSYDNYRIVDKSVLERFSDYYGYYGSLLVSKKS